jgi:hypothetical protein
MPFVCTKKISECIGCARFKLLATRETAQLIVLVTPASTHGHMNFLNFAYHTDTANALVLR